MTAILPWWTRWAALAALCAAVAIFTGVKVHAHDRIALDALQGRFDAFRTQVAYAGKLAQIAADKEIAAGKLAKENADAENSRTHAADIATIASLRRERDSARRSAVPAAPAGSSRPDLACFERTALESALGGFIAEIRGLADEGTAATVDLNTAKLWAKKGP